MIHEEEIKSIEYLLKEKKIVLMGRGEHITVIKKILESIGCAVWRIWDNDINKQGGKLEGIPIEAPRAGVHSLFVIIYSPRHWESMLNQVLSLNYMERAVFVLDKPSVKRNFLMLFRGKALYKKICHQHGNGVQVFLASGPLGDYYLLSLFFREYCHMNGIENYVIVGNSKGIGRISSFLGLSPAEELSAYDTAALEAFWKFVGRREDIKIKPLTIWQGDFRFNTCMIRQKQGFNFMDTVRYMIFSLHKGEPCYPKWQYRPERAEKILHENGLPRGRTVLLVPFAYSMASLSREFWQELADLLIGHGFVVVVNAVGDEEKNLLEGTYTLSLSFPDVMDFMEHGAAVIGIRCGFFDITSQARCKRIVLYPPKASGSISWQKTSLDFCGLKVMGLCDDAYEWEVKDAEEIQQRILSIL